MRSRSAIVGLAALLATACTTAGAADTVYLLSPAQIDRDAVIDPVIRKDCAIGENISRTMAKALERQFDVVVTATAGQAGEARLLKLSIIKVIGKSGSVWTGRKGIVLRGTLHENGETVGSFTAQRRSSGGAWGLFNDACYILDRCTISLGKDIARWLERPAMNSWLGEMSEN